MALDEMKKLANTVNEAKRREEEMTRMFQVVRTVDDCPPTIISAHRRILFELEAFDVTRDFPTLGTHFPSLSTGISIVPSVSTVTGLGSVQHHESTGALFHIFIFSDILLVAKPKGKRKREKSSGSKKITGMSNDTTRKDKLVLFRLAWLKDVEVVDLSDIVGTSRTMGFSSRQTQKHLVKLVLHNSESATPAGRRRFWAELASANTGMSGAEFKSQERKQIQEIITLSGSLEQLNMDGQQSGTASTQATVIMQSESHTDGAIRSTCSAPASPVVVSDSIASLSTVVSNMTLSTASSLDLPILSPTTAMMPTVASLEEMAKSRLMMSPGVLSPPLHDGTAVDGSGVSVQTASTLESSSAQTTSTLQGILEFQSSTAPEASSTLDLGMSPQSASSNLLSVKSDTPLSAAAKGSTSLQRSSTVHITHRRSIGPRTTSLSGTNPSITSLLENMSVDTAGMQSDTQGIVTTAPTHRPTSTSLPSPITPILGSTFDDELSRNLRARSNTIKEHHLSSLNQSYVQGQGNASHSSPGDHEDSLMADLTARFGIRGRNRQTSTSSTTSVRTTATSRSNPTPNTHTELPSPSSSATNTLPHPNSSQNSVVGYGPGVSLSMSTNTSAHSTRDRPVSSMTSLGSIHSMMANGEPTQNVAEGFILEFGERKAKNELMLVVERLVISKKMRPPGGM
jgi:hypothetical protein